MLQYALTAQCVEVEGTCERRRVGAYGLREEDDGVALGYVEAFKHCIGKDIACDLPPVVGQVPVVSESIETRAWSACYRVTDQWDVSIRTRGLHLEISTNHQWDLGRSSFWAARSGGRLHCHK
jgi:hypothetical protein